MFAAIRPAWCVSIFFLLHGNTPVTAAATVLQIWREMVVAASTPGAANLEAGDNQPSEGRRVIPMRDVRAAARDLATVSHGASAHHAAYRGRDLPLRGQCPRDYAGESRAARPS